MTDPPRTRAELDALVASYDADLAATEVTRRTVAFLRRPPLPGPARLGYAVLLAGAASTLRPQHRALLGLPEPGRAVPRAATRAVLTSLRALLSDGPPAARSARSRLDRIDSAPA